MVGEVRGWVELMPPYSAPEAVRDLEGFSHIWIVFLFDRTATEGWRPTVRPPKLGGNRRVGVFASRSNFRPNPIGISAVRLERIETRGDRTLLHVRGLDILDGTPVLDIKPYVPYTDALPEASPGFAVAPAAAPLLDLGFADSAKLGLAQAETDYPGFGELLAAVLQQDPRPGYRETEDMGEYGLSLAGWNVRWTVCDSTIRVETLSRIAPDHGDPSNAG